MHTGFGIGSSLSSPFQTNPFTAYGFTPYASAQQPIQQWLQLLPQQIHQLQQLAYVQQQQLQQILQIVPVQLQQLQQAIQFVPQQLQQLLHLVAQQQFGAQGVGAVSQPQGLGTPFQGFSPFTVPFAGSGQIM